MTVQEAYNKGLDTAETEAIEKLTNALQKIDGEPFVNPAMEALRQSILTIEPPAPVDDTELFTALEVIMRGGTYSYVGPKEKTIILDFYTELIAYLRPKMSRKNEIGVKMKSLVGKADFQLTLERSKVN